MSNSEFIFRLTDMLKNNSHSKPFVEILWDIDSLFMEFVECLQEGEEIEISLDVFCPWDDENTEGASTNIEAEIAFQVDYLLFREFATRLAIRRNTPPKCRNENGILKRAYHKESNLVEYSVAGPKIACEAFVFVFRFFVSAVKRYREQVKCVCNRFLPNVAVCDEFCDWLVDDLIDNIQIAFQDKFSAELMEGGMDDHTTSVSQLPC